MAGHLDKMRPVTAEVYVDGPVYRQVQVIARIEIQPYASPDQVSLAITGALNAYLSPLPVPLADGTLSTPRDFGANFYPSQPLPRDPRRRRTWSRCRTWTCRWTASRSTRPAPSRWPPMSCWPPPVAGSYELTVVPQSGSPAGPG